MKKTCVIVILFMFLCLFVAGNPIYAYSPDGRVSVDNRPEPLIRVGLMSEQPQVIISAESDFMLVAVDLGKIIAVFQAHEPVRVAARNQVLLINNKPVESSLIRVSFNAAGGGITGRGSGLELSTDEAELERSLEYNQKGRFLTVNQQRYRGLIQIKHTAGKNGLTIIEQLPIEQYLYGVIAKEIATEWSLEAVKAQAIAARNYALYYLNKHKNDGYDVCPTVHCQVYGGVDAETSRGTKAVDDTRGQVVMYQGKVIPTYFHASSGGYTENSENVWGSHVPYLRGVPDFDQNNKNFVWEKRISVMKLTELLRAEGHKIGYVTAVRLSMLQQPSASLDRGVSGRVKTVEFIGTTGTAQVSGAKLRSMLGLDSTLFDIAFFSPTPLAPAAGPREQDVQAGRDLMPAPLLQPTDIRTIRDPLRDEIVIIGFGKGHGVGLSQWGAKALAEKAPADDVNYYKEILAYYYQNITIEKLY